MGKSDHNMLSTIISIAQRAGDAILSVYETAFQVSYKEDRTPVTDADLTSNNIIKTELQKHFPNIPILSEENKRIPYEERRNWEEFWLIDPLDGTKEFVKQNGEFTVNIALICGCHPIIGVIYAPVTGVLHYADEVAAYKQTTGEAPLQLSPHILTDRTPIVIAVSRSHLNTATMEYIQSLNREYELIAIGSSMKFGLVAEGTADLYPRLGTTMEWDTAAGHAIVNRVGRKVLKLNSLEEVTYNKPSPVNSWFVVK